jgi:hypothetical protein
MRTRAAIAWYAICVAGLTYLHPSQCVKLPSWRGPDTFFDGTLPSNRFSHGFESCDDGRIYVFGGQTQTGNLIRTEVNIFRDFARCMLSWYFFAATGPELKNDLHVFDPVSLTWFNLSIHPLGTPPAARSGHGFTSAGGKLYLHGGYHGGGKQ